MRAPQEHTNFSTRLKRTIAFSVLAIAVLALIISHILAWHWASMPFLGMMLEPTLVLSPFEGKDWARLNWTPRSARY